MDKEDVAYIYIYIYIHTYKHTHTHTHTHTMEYYSAIKKNQILSIAVNLNGLGRHYAKWNKLDSERQTLFDITICGI